MSRQPLFWHPGVHSLPIEVKGGMKGWATNRNHVAPVSGRAAWTQPQSKRKDVKHHIGKSRAQKEGLSTFSLALPRQLKRHWGQNRENQLTEKLGQNAAWKYHPAAI